jgi:glucose uptake protein GlcU
MEECCGYFAAFVSCVAFGTFAVPIKCAAVRKVDVDPLGTWAVKLKVNQQSYLLIYCFAHSLPFVCTVLQTYKIGMTLLTSWLVLLFGVPFTFTPWGFVSGLFMVPGGTAGYFAVQNAGMAVSQGIWSSLKVLVAFCWGILIFHEPVHSKLGTTLAIALLMVGLAGVSIFAAPRTSTSSPQEEPLLPDVEEQNQPEIVDNKDYLGFLKRRHFGLLGAVIDGAYGGSVLVPMHYAGPATTNGLSYVMSFAIGCSSVVTMVWVLRLLFNSVQEQSLRVGYDRLPSLHVTTIGPYAALAGLIWSLGNVSSILTVALLGEGVGYSIVQSQLLVAGLWGVFWYKEIRGMRAIASWFTFAVITVAGIVMLSREHVPVPAEAP